jgi:histone deacetylase HOS2
MDSFKEDLDRFGFGGDTNDCPVFDGLWDYVSIYSGASIHAANALRNNTSDIAINWSGGLHHAKKSAASGFCYINDIVMAIQLLLTVHQRVLYIDIDVHHGDGVEQAFWSTPRVFTLSFHKYGDDFFPGTGSMDDTGPRYRGNPGTAHSLNIPIDDGIDDHEYKDLFQHVVQETIDRYRPNAVVLQCGADSLGGDRLGRFNLNIKAHGFCVEFLKQQRLPLLLLGGGGYTPRNVARTWCHETAVCVGLTLHDDLPQHIPYIQAFDGDENGSLQLYPNLSHLTNRRHENKQTKKSLEELKRRASENLSYIEGCPTASDQFKHVDWAQLLDHIEEENSRRQEEAEEKERMKSEQDRRRKERNVGGRLERAFR